jgi:CMP-N-acetylneuraminic acid synthetase/2-polyprenyl-3-methyl-5-hydroxy-6-metoxy-1,4-benzoquinol methylase
MIDNSRVLAILPIRSGSKRIKNKNIRTVGYYPLFCHLIFTCLMVEEIDKIVVSVDCEEYEHLVKKFFGNNIKVRTLIRPNEFATDDSKSEQAMLHAIDHLKDLGEHYDYTILVQATTPLTLASDILKGLVKISSNPNLNSTFSVSESKKFYLDDIETLIERPMTQRKKPRLYENGCFWCVRTEKFKIEKNRIVEPFDYITTNEYDALDIDSESDMIIVDMLLSRRVREEEKRYYQHRSVIDKIDVNQYFGDKQDPDGNTRNILNEKQDRINFAIDEVKYINSLPNVNKNNKMELLSIGCGGGYAESTISSSFNINGIEPDYEAYRIAKGLLDKVKHGIFDANDYEKCSFDVVFCHHVIEHVYNPIEFIKGIYLILKPGGKLVIGTPNFDGAMSRRYGENFRMLHDKTHVSLFSDFTLKDLLEDNMFLIERIHYPYFETKYFNINELKRLFSNERVSPPFYGNIFTVYAEKK